MARNEGGKMRLRNKRTGEIVSLEGELLFDNEVMLLKQYSSLAELCEEWEDYKELEYWYIDDNGDILLSDLDGDKIWEDLAGQRKQIGNYFETQEEAELAVRKLKAWKLLRDECDIKFDGVIRDDKAMLKGVSLSYDRHQVTLARMRECSKALHLLFGGEE